MASVPRSQTPKFDANEGSSKPADMIRLRRNPSVRPDSRNSYIANNNADLEIVSHGGLVDPSPATHSSRFHEELESQPGSSVAGPTQTDLHRSNSQGSTHSYHNNNVPKKKSSFSRKPSVRRHGSRRSLHAGSVKSLHLGDREKYGVEGSGDFNSAFYVPIPTTGHPTNVLADRFQGSFSSSLYSCFWDLIRKECSWLIFLRNRVA